MMTEFATSTTEPSYLTRLALRSSPFNNSIEPELFFVGGQAEHRLNLLLHLLRSSDKIANLIADDGLGKSSILKQLQLRAGDELRVCLLDADQQLNSVAMLAQCLIDLGIDSSDLRVTDDPVDVLKNRLEQVVKLNIRPVLLIDNAEGLDDEALANLSEWLSWHNGSDFLLGAVLASSQALTLASDAQARLQIVDLPPLTETEVAPYLLHRLNGVGFTQQLPFTDKDIRRITQQSLGYPARINQLAHQKLLGIKTAHKFPILESSTFKHISRWSGLVVVILSLLVLVSFQQDINQWLTSDTSDRSVDEQNVVEVLEPNLTEVDVTKAQDESDELVQREELAKLLAELPEVEVAEQAEITSKTGPAFLSEKWVLKQASTHYTFQLMGSWERREVHEFIEKYALSGDVAIFESLRNGRTWHVLVYGSYTDKQTALAASSDWPAPLNTLPSWLRRFDSVQKQIKNTAVVQ